MHVEKYSKSAVGHMLKHYSRTVMNFSNREINHLHSDLNYNLAHSRNMDEMQYYRNRLAQVKCQNRMDVKTLCDWIITLPKMVFVETQERQFFQLAYAFMSERYGEENVISAWVHKDEVGQPHMHFAFVPVCIDKKKGIEKISAKEVLTRNELRRIHVDMSNHMENMFGYDVGILNGATAGGNKMVAELKIKTIEEKLCALEKAENQSVLELASIIKKRPKTLSTINRAVEIAMGNERSLLEKKQNRVLERDR